MKQFKVEELKATLPEILRIKGCTEDEGEDGQHEGGGNEDKQQEYDLQDVEVHDDEEASGNANVDEDDERRKSEGGDEDENQEETEAADVDDNEQSEPENDEDDDEGRETEDDDDDHQQHNEYEDGIMQKKGKETELQEERKQEQSKEDVGKHEPHDKIKEVAAAKETKQPPHQVTSKFGRTPSFRLLTPTPPPPPNDVEKKEMQEENLRLTRALQDANIQIQELKKAVEKQKSQQSAGDLTKKRIVDLLDENRFRASRVEELKKEKVEMEKEKLEIQKDKLKLEMEIKKLEESLASTNEVIDVLTAEKTELQIEKQNWQNSISDAKSIIRKKSHEMLRKDEYNSKLLELMNEKEEPYKHIIHLLQEQQQMRKSNSS